MYISNTKLLINELILRKVREGVGEFCNENPLKIINTYWKMHNNFKMLTLELIFNCSNSALRESINFTLFSTSDCRLALSFLFVIKSNSNLADLVFSKSNKLQISFFSSEITLRFSFRDVISASKSCSLFSRWHFSDWIVDKSLLMAWILVWKKKEQNQKKYH